MPVEETASEELSRLRAELTSSKQLLESKDAQLACKDELLASRAAELQRCEELLQHRTAAAESGSTAAEIIKRQRLYDSSVSPLERDGLLDHVFSFVGGCDHLYIGGVSRRWRGRYMQYCASQRTTSNVNDKVVTRHRSAIMTESRLRFALASGLSLEGRTFSDWCTAPICRDSLEPEMVITLLRAHGLAWSTRLCDEAALHDKLALLQWLFSQSCPWDKIALLSCASMYASTATLEWLLTVTSPWPSSMKRAMILMAACENELDVVQWLRAQGADWPNAFCNIHDGIESLCCSLPAVQWALSCGSGWLEWKCEDYAAEKYQRVKSQQQATELLEWAHANECPCTCGHVQQQQQQQK
jgi:hypothetical protein